MYYCLVKKGQEFFLSFFLFAKNLRFVFFYLATQKTKEMIKKIIKSFLLDLVMFLLDPNKEKFPQEKELYDKAESAGKKYLKALILEVLKDLDEQEQNENNLSK